MTKKLLRVLLIILSVFISLSYLGFQSILANIEKNERNNQIILLNDIQTQINLAYELLDKLLIEKRKSYLEIHNYARKLISHADTPVDLSNIQNILEKKSGYKVDLYLINSDLVVTNTTFEPDLGSGY